MKMYLDYSNLLYTLLPLTFFTINGKSSITNLIPSYLISILLIHVALHFAFLCKLFNVTD